MSTPNFEDSTEPEHRKCPQCGWAWGTTRTSVVMGPVWDCGRCGTPSYDGEEGGES